VGNVETKTTTKLESGQTRRRKIKENAVGEGYCISVSK